MFQSKNPILTRSESFNGRGSVSADQQYGQSTGQYQQTQYEQYPNQQGQYQQPPQQRPQSGRFEPHQDSQGDARGVMTLDDVLTKTAIVMGTLVAVAALAWILVPQALTMPVMIVSALVGFVTVLFVVIRRGVNPVTAMVYAAIEGVFIGMFSRVFESYYPGIVVQAVLATFIVAGVVLAAYKFSGFRVTERFKKIVMISTIAFAGAVLLNFGLSFAGIDMGLRAGITGPVSPLAIGVSLLAVVLATFNLVMDFDMIENGIRNRAPASQSWVAAFGITVTMVWLYTEILRIISYFRR